jgi:hypothetical protein
MNQETNQDANTVPNEIVATEEKPANPPGGHEGDYPLPSAPPVELGAQAPGAADPESPQTPQASAAGEAKDLKIVIMTNARGTMVGMQKTGCDPQFFPVKDLADAVKSIPGLLDMALKKWAVEPRYPLSPKPPPLPVTATPAPATAARPAASQTAKPTIQKSMF